MQWLFSCHHLRGHAGSSRVGRHDDQQSVLWLSRIRGCYCLDKSCSQRLREALGDELLFKQLKQNFPLRFFYGESANAIKIQIWITLIANLLLMVMQKRIQRPWSFSGLATMYRIMLMYYLNPYSFFEAPEKDWQKLLKETETSPPQPTFFDWRGLLDQK